MWEVTLAFIVRLRGPFECPGKITLKAASSCAFDPNMHARLSGGFRWEGRMIQCSFSRQPVPNDSVMVTIYPIKSTVL